MKQVLMTGASSFTGAHIARAFREKGYEVTALLTQDKHRYDEALIQKRLQHAELSTKVFECPFGSEKMLELISQGSYEIFINHGAHIKGYRDPSFSPVPSLEAALKNLSQVVGILKAKHCLRFIHSGSIFEPDEGTERAGENFSSEAVSIYGVTKAMVWQAVRFYCLTEGLALSKVIIADPIGAFENPDRMIPFFVKQWKEGVTPLLKVPNLVRDRVPAPWLARFYVDEAAQLENGVRVRRPSAFAMSNQEFVEMFMKEWRAVAGTSETLRIEDHKSTEPLKRVNSELCHELKSATEIAQFWKTWLSSLLLF